MRTPLPALGLLVLALGATPASAAVDLNGPWRLTVVPSLVPTFSCQVAVVQAGTALTVSGPGCAFPFNASGTIDTLTGVFSGSGASDPLLCPALAISGTSAGTSTGFTGSFTCSGGLIPVTGTFQGSRCGNGALDAGEQCDDGDVLDQDCCSATCTFDPPTYSCNAGPCSTGQCNGAGTCVLTPEPAGTWCGTGGECTTDVCDGAGLCTHPLRPVGSPCFGDFNPCTDGACDAGGTCVLTNNTAPCDDYNACTLGDTCAGGTCVPGTPGPPGVECELDGDLCTLESCDAAGGCLPTGGCSDCCSGPGCTAALGTCKDPTVPGSLVHLRHVTGPTDLLRFLWKRGAETSFLDFGTPTATTDYTLCVYFDEYPYDGSTDLAYRATAPAGGMCAGRPCWHVNGTRGFSYKDRERTPDGIDVVKLKAGVAGTAGVIVKGKGPNLGIGYLGDGTGGGLKTPTVQLRSSDAACFEARFPTAVRDNGYEYRSNAGE